MSIFLGLIIDSPDALLAAKCITASYLSLAKSFDKSSFEFIDPFINLVFRLIFSLLAVERLSNTVTSYPRPNAAKTT